MLELELHTNQYQSMKLNKTVVLNLLILSKMYVSKTLVTCMSSSLFQLINGVYGEDDYTRFDRTKSNSTLDYFWWQSNMSS